MKVILRENIDNVGKKGDIVNVAAGFGRNYLIPKKFAIEVTPTNMKMVEIEQQALKKRLEKDIASYQSLIEKVNQTALSFTRKATEKDMIFGSVSATDIKEELDKLDISVEKKKIMLDEPIKKLGDYVVPIKIFQDEKAEVKVKVIGDKKSKEEEEKTKEAAPVEKKEEAGDVEKEKKEDIPVEKKDETKKATPVEKKEKAVVQEEESKEDVPKGKEEKEPPPAKKEDHIMKKEKGGK